jgi:hypothetical protein
MKKLHIILIIISAGCFFSCQKKATYLSSLSAGKDFPLYTTYAAAQERSDFVLDEGYEFRYDSDAEGADFKTDTGGDICMGFRKDGKWVYRVADMYKPPVITTSYPDLVKYEYEPFQGIKVSSVFMTYSSRTALLDITVNNQNKEKAEIDLIPFMRSNSRSFHSVSLGKDENYIAFSHEEFPDSWTTSHNLPYTDSIRNIFMFSSSVDEVNAFSSESGESPMIPSEIFLSRKPVRQLTGRLYSPQGERLAGGSTINRLQLLVDDNEDIMITENSSVWGTTQPTFAQDGYFTVEGGNISPGAKKYRLTGYNEKLGKQVSVTGNFKGETERCDLKLTETTLPVIGNIRYENNRIEWTKPGDIATFSVYRRSYPEVTYRRIAKGISESTFFDNTAEKGKRYGYMVTCLSNGRSGIQSREVVNIRNSDFYQYVKTGILPESIPENARIVTLLKKLQIAPGDSENLRIIRSVSAVNELQDSVLIQAKKILKTDLNPFLKSNEKLLSKVKTFDFRNKKQEALFWSNVNMMRQVFYPPQAKSKYNYYVFSREPTWGWGHGGQVFHESIAMLAYADVDPEGAMNSQRVYSQRQYPNGYINYRTGSFLDEKIEYNGELTSSAPWYSWLNWEVYKMTKDKVFLKEMYGSSVKFYNFYTSNRDKDGDGLCEWGGEAILESVRDALVAVWDQVGYPSNFEALDLNCMLVMEAKSLEAMARELGLEKEAEKWKADHEKRAALINKYCWDKETGFYYNVNKSDHSFTFKTPNDLKRMEIIGFLPLWAGIADEEQAKSILSHLTNPAKFWRKYGIPSLAADDKYYNDKGYWNGPVWVQWNYLVMKGLVNYGYKDEAEELVEKVSTVMYDRLEKDHNLWEFYSPDYLWGGHHKTYIWAGIVNRMMKDVSNQQKQ